MHSSSSGAKFEEEERRKLGKFWKSVSVIQGRGQSPGSAQTAWLLPMGAPLKSACFKRTHFAHCLLRCGIRDRKPTRHPPSPSHRRSWTLPSARLVIRWLYHQHFSNYRKWKFRDLDGKLNHNHHTVNSTYDRINQDHTPYAPRRKLNS